MAYCHIHGEHDEDVYGCPDCQREERDQRDAREEQSERLREQSEHLEQIAEANAYAAHRLQNPGDFQCPHCMMISLKRGASCCPLCRRDVSKSDWNEIEQCIVQEKEAARL